jgi:hypothetical protein
MKTKSRNNFLKTLNFLEIKGFKNAEYLDQENNENSTL